MKFIFGRYLYLGVEYYGDRIDIFKSAKRKLEKDGKLLCIIPEGILEDNKIRLKSHVGEINEDDNTFEINKIWIDEEEPRNICFDSNDQKFKDLCKTAQEKGVRLLFESSFMISGALPFTNDDNEDKCVGFLNLVLVGFRKL